MKKNSLIFILNILLIIIIFFAIDYTCFLIHEKRYGIKLNYIGNMTKKIATSKSYDYNYLKNNIQWRKPLNVTEGGGVKHKSIVYTGCSFAYGQGLKEEETVSYRTAQLVKNPVYNLGIISKAVNTLIAMLKNGVFEEKVNIDPAVVIYIYADFHIMRLVIPNMPYESNEFLYKIKNEKLERKKPPFIISRFPLLSSVREWMYYILFENSNSYKEYLKKLLKLHFIELKNILDEKYNNVKLIIFVYYDSPLFEEIAQDLQTQGIIIIRSSHDLGLDINLADKQYQLQDGHPNKKVWEIVTPKLVEKIKPYLN